MGKQRMTGAITVRFKRESLKLLRERAKSKGTTPSEVVRSVVEHELDPEFEKTLYERGKELIGSITKGPVVHGRDARKLLAKWKPTYRRD